MHYISCYAIVDSAPYSLDSARSYDCITGDSTSSPVLSKQGNESDDSNDNSERGNLNDDDDVFDSILSWEDELYVLDIKSMNSFLFKNLIQPKQENVFQLQLYLHFFGIKKGILLYVNKDTQELKEFIILYDRVLSTKLLKDLESLKTKIDLNTIPKRLLSYPKDKECQFCQFREICKKATANEMSWKEFKRRLGAQQTLL